MTEEELGLKVSTKEGAWWNNVKAKLEEQIFNSKLSLIADQKMLEIVKEQLELENKKMGNIRKV